MVGALRACKHWGPSGPKVCKSNTKVIVKLKLKLKCARNVGKYRPLGPLEGPYRPISAPISLILPVYGALSALEGHLRPHITANLPHFHLKHTHLPLFCTNCKNLARIVQDLCEKEKI